MVVFLLTHNLFIAPSGLNYYMVVYTVYISFNNYIIYNFINNRRFYYGNNTLQEKKLEQNIAISLARKLLSTARFPFMYCGSMTGYGMCREGVVTQQKQVASCTSDSHVDNM